MYTLQYLTPSGVISLPAIVTSNKEEVISILKKHLHKARVTPTIVNLRHHRYIGTKLAVFDLDGTLTSQEYMDRLAEVSPNKELLQRLTQEAVEGGCSDWEENFRQRVQLLAGIPQAIADEVAHNIPLACGVRQMIQDLKNRGISLAIITGAYQGLASSVANRLGIREYYSSHLEVKDGVLTGSIIGSPLSPEKKVHRLRHLLYQKGLSPMSCTAIGDSTNDLPMLTECGQSLLYHAIQTNPLPINTLQQFII